MGAFSSQKIRVSLSALFIAVVIVSAASISRASEYTSTSFIVSDSAFGSGQESDSSNFSITGFLSQLLFGSFSSSGIPLVPGTITSCGKITTPGTYTLNVDLSNISGACFTVATSSVTIDGNGHAISAAVGNTSYAIMATSTSSGGSGYSNLSVQNISFSGFSGGGVNISGNPGTSIGGFGGSVSVSSSSLGSINANGGNGSANGGNGGSIALSGTNLDLVTRTLSVNGGSGSVSGSLGTITVNGSVLIPTGFTWNGNDSSWLGSRTWRFEGNSYNTGTVTGTTTFAGSSYNAGTVVGDEILMAYTGDGSGTVSISGNSSVRGTGTVTGGVSLRFRRSIDHGLGSIERIDPRRQDRRERSIP